MRKWGVALGAAACATFMGVAGAGVVSAEGSTADAPTALVEADTCARPTPLPAVTGTRTDGETIVSFAVPNETRLQVRDGEVVAASTNTGCAPDAVDAVVVVGDDGGRRPASAAEIDQARTNFRSGDWRTPGVWHDDDA
jgi:hypothetical protein